MKYVVIFKIPVLVEESQTPEEALDIAAEMCNAVYGFRPTISSAIIEEKSDRNKKYFYSSKTGVSQIYE
jgi:hypothetical protein